MSSSEERIFSDSDGDSKSSNEEDSPIAVKRKIKKRAVIESSDSESDEDVSVNNVTSQSKSSMMQSYRDVSASTTKSEQSSLEIGENEPEIGEASESVAIPKTKNKKRGVIESSDSESDEDVSVNNVTSQNKSSMIQSYRDVSASTTKSEQSSLEIGGNESEIGEPSASAAIPKTTEPTSFPDSDSETADELDFNSDGEDAEIERNVLSPRTRMSMTGIREKDIEYSSDSDDDSIIVKNDNSMKEPIIIEESDAEDISYNQVDSLNESVKFISENLGKPSASSYLSSTPAKLLQPKITNVLKVYVSEEEYYKEVTKLNDLENELQRFTKLNETMKNNLPDKGRRLSGRIDALKEDVKRQMNYIGTLVIDSKPNLVVKSPEQIKPEPGAIGGVSWNELDQGVNEVLPKFTGKIGMKNFMAAKIMTMERLKDIHGSLATCPAEDVLAEDPSGLKVPLMDHQRHALAWMEWRETQRPRGGILADDMGLGKTLTCIAHVLACNERIENANTESDSEEEETPNADTERIWSAKGRKDWISGKTLVVCPASLIGQWESEIKKRVSRNILEVLVHHGTSRDSKARRIAKNDFVVTTYQILSRDYQDDGPLYSIKWDRVILDEAHIIRNHKAKVSIAACNVIRKNCWILTGTPIQNKDMDMYALMKFLKCRPFDDFAQFKKWIANKSAGGQQRLTTIMKGILLRRTKLQLLDRGDLTDLPSKTVELVYIKLDKDEMNVYSKILIFSKTLFAQYLHQKADKNDDIYYGDRVAPPKDKNAAYFKAHQRLQQIHGNKEVKSHEILVLILRLRQICCHPGLITAMLEEHDTSSGFDNSHDGNDISMDLIEQLNRIKITDSDLIGDDTEEDAAGGKASAKILMKSNPVYDFNRPTSKIRKIMEVLKTRVLPSKEKAIIVSQWTAVLKILGRHLSRDGIKFVSLNGTVAVKDRGEIVKNFNEDRSGPQVMLLSLTAGGVGLNLVGANHLFLIDLHWNPQLEAQAQDRIYRVGQKKPVSIYKFVCQDTIEERIKVLQDKKLQVADGILTGSKVVGSKLSIDDLKSLFDV